MIKLHSSSTPSNPIAHILTVQGHPEFTPGIVEKVVNAREETKVFDTPTAAEARRRLGGKDGSGGEGFGRVGWAIWRVMLQPRPTMGDVPVDVEMTDGSNKVATYLSDETRYSAIDKVLERSGPWTDEQFVGGAEVGKLVAKLIIGQESTERDRQNIGNRRRGTRL